MYAEHAYRAGSPRVGGLPWRLATPVFLALVFVVRPVFGQTIRGQVIDSLSGLQVGAGFVVLVADDGAEIARTLTNEDGSFAIDVPGGYTGQLRLRSERIGYRLAVTGPFDAPSGDVDGTVIHVRAIPIRLTDIEAREDSECLLSPSEGERTAAVWQEARKALAAASWTSSQIPYRVLMDMWTRDQDGRRREILSETHRRSFGASTIPFASRSPEDLHESGYIVSDAAGYQYTGPDAHVLQSSGFLDTHCFRLRNGDDDTMIGLSFQPAPSRNLPDVKGVLWIDRDSWQLRSLEFEFVNLPEDLRGGDPARGSVEFLPLPSGAWIVHRWHMEFPTAFREERVDEFDRFARRRASAFRTAGGEVLSITDEAGVVMFETEFAEIVGTVIDSSRGRANALARSIVTVSGTWFADTTDADGRFQLRVPLSGEYAVNVEHPRIDSLVFGPSPAQLTLVRGASVSRSFIVPPLEALFDTICLDRSAGANNYVLVGTVIDSATSTPISRASAVAQWQHIASNLDFADRQSISITDDQGRFALCGLEGGRPALVYVVSSLSRSDVVRVAFEPGYIEVGNEGVESSSRIWRRDIVVGRTPRRQTSLSGFIVSSTTGEPIPDVDVRLSGTDISTKSDSAGLFVLGGFEGRNHRLTLVKPGYNTRWGNVRVHDDQPTIIGGDDLTLTPVPQVTGVVREAATNRPIGQASVTLLGAADTTLVTTRSDSLGGFTLTAPFDGSFSVSVRRLGFAPHRTDSFELRSGHAADVPIAMRAGVFALDPIAVTAEAPERYLSQVGFYARQRSNRGYFLDRDDIEKRLGSSPDVFQLLAVLPGVDIGDPAPGDFGSRAYVSRAVRGQGCDHGPGIVVDGIEIEYSQVGGGQPSYDAIGTVVRPGEVQAVEVYRTASQVPPEYGGPTSSCGLVLIWTQRGAN